MERLLFGVRNSAALLGVGVGLAYGLLARLMFGLDVFEGLFEVMTLSFIFIVPVIIGFVTVYVHPGEPPGWGRSAALPLASGLLTIVAALLLAWEGLVCAVVWVPIFFVLAVVGGLIAGVARRMGGRTRPLVLASVAVVPFVTAPLEHQLPDPFHVRTVEDRIVIAADPATVWAQIREVPPIAPAELAPSFAHRIGFPRPIAARLDGEGVGAVRHATFEGGVVFVERVTAWAPGRSLAFTIDAGAVPPTTFDQHVAVGGRYFDVLEGRYRIEPLADGRVALHLASTHRLSTRFNGYTRLWTDLFMRDIQQNILQVIRDRSERAAPSLPPRP
jgi:hypothetical protein